MRGGNAPPRVFAGPGLKQGKDTGGSDNAHFMGPSSVACDAKGRVYVADHHNDRIQVFSPDGGPAAPSVLVKTIPVSRPAEVCVHQKTGDIYVFSWLFHGPWNFGEKPEAPVPAVFRHLGPLEDPREISACPLPLRGYIGRATAWMQDPGGRQYHAAVDSWTDPPTLYPGRGGRAVVNVWDKYGRLVTADAIPGLGILDGLAIDKNNDLYVLAATTRVLDGKRYFDYMTGTEVKFRFGKAKVITSDDTVRIPLPAGAGPKRPQELDDGAVGPAWAEGREWFYGGLGFTGKDGAHASGGCACWNARFCLDYFARSFVPEIQHYSVGVLDTNGNLILRVGRYGNVDDGKPLVAEGGPPNPRSIGGDEVGLFYPAYLGAQTDRRLFIADPGNSRILSVRLNYHAMARVDLKDVKEWGSE